PPATRKRRPGDAAAANAHGVSSRDDIPNANQSHLPGDGDARGRRRARAAPARRPRVSPAPAPQTLPPDVVSLPDHEAHARGRLDDNAWAYFNGGAADELCLQANR